MKVDSNQRELIDFHFHNLRGSYSPITCNLGDWSVKDNLQHFIPNK